MAEQKRPSEQKKQSALEKNFSVLEAATNTGTFSSVAEQTGLPVATVHRILTELVQSGWLFQGEDRVYRPGRRAYMFAACLDDDTQLASIAQPYLAELSEQTELTVHFGLRKNDEVVYAAKTDGPKPYRMKSRVGGVVPLYSTSIGKSIMATMDKEAVESSIARTGFVQLTSKTITSLADLYEDLGGVRERGWAVDNSENEEGLRCIGAPVLRGDGLAIGGVSVTGLDHEVPDGKVGEIAHQVVRAAGRISEVLGAV